MLRSNMSESFFIVIKRAPSVSSRTRNWHYRASVIYHIGTISIIQSLLHNISDVELIARAGETWNYSNYTSWVLNFDKLKEYLSPVRERKDFFHKINLLVCVEPFDLKVSNWRIDGLEMSVKKSRGWSVRVFLQLFLERSPLFRILNELVLKWIFV